jgi:hypothetical protein
LNSTPSHGKEAGLAGERLWLVCHGVADVARDRSGKHDSQGQSEVAKGDTIAQAGFISALFGIAA